MDHTYNHLDVRHRGDVSCVRFLRSALDEDELYEMCVELHRLIPDGCRKVVLVLSPDPQFLYSIFLAKLVSLQRRLREVNGALKLAEVSTNIMAVFEACRLHKHFDFAPTEDAAVAALSAAVRVHST
jgi:anti-anti-sigma factor